MSALRKAGVWLGLVEEDDEQRYGDYDDNSYRSRNRYSGSRYADDEFADEDEVEDDRPRVGEDAAADAGARAVGGERDAFV